ncbi:6-phosphogluconolactonase [Polystyrenella longa]|uniref:6-phosphogluconolactonase n=2 Tax=Polystyrenella longa TaxID=2528007 RepID=A0A518CJV3_9PLAN|nr:6-phosphogluconolactonase [Polystyrenella longa]
MGMERGEASEANREMMYLSIGGENRIALWNVDPETGLASEVGSVNTGGAPGALTFNPKQDRLYAAVRSTGEVVTYEVNGSNGGLKELGRTPVLANPVYIATDRNGKFLLTAYYGEAKAAVYRIDEEGVVVADAVSTVESTRHPHSIDVDLANQNVYIPNTGADLIQQFRFNSDSGELTPLEPENVKTAEKSGGRHFVFAPSNKHVYFVNEHNCHVDVFERDQTTGALTQIQTISTLPEGYTEKSFCADIEITLDGKYIYASNRGHDSLAMYSVDQATGKLTSLGQIPTEAWPREFGLDPQGKFVYSAGQNSHKLAAYRIDPETGILAPFATYPVGQSPAWVLIKNLD